MVKSIKYNGTDKNPVSDGKQKIMILGGGPNRIGQGIEFDYCCVHASLALKKLGFETVMLPEVCRSSVGNVEGINLVYVSQIRDAISYIMRK